MKNLLVTVVLFYPTFLQAQNTAQTQTKKTDGVTSDPVAVIEGPTSARIGDLMFFNGYMSENSKHFKWRILPEGTLGFTVVDGGQRAIFSNRNPGEYIIILGVGGGELVDIAIHRVLVGVDAKDVARPIMSITTELGTIDENELLLKTSTVASLAQEWKKGLKSKTVQVDSSKLAGIFRTCAASTVTGKVTSKKQLVDNTKSRATKALGDTSFEKWKPWFESLETYLKTLDSSSKIPVVPASNSKDEPVTIEDPANLSESLDNATTLEQYREIWLQIAMGLERI